MICPQCGNDNPSKLKFCVRCGMNLENPQEINYEQVDMGNYHSEEDQSSGGFSLGGGTFTICDTAPAADSSSDFYTADELNSDEEEFDFSSFDEPFIPKLDTDRLSMPQMNNTPRNQQMHGFSQQQFPAQGGMNNIPQTPQNPQMNPMPAMTGVPQPMGMNGIPQMPAPQPQIIGYDQNGTPIYGQPQPMMYAQPQIIGYDQNGMPIYGQPQPMMYAQPQIIGYDQNGMPVYGQPQPMMYAQPQIIGYDQNGMPIYGQPQPVMYQQPVQPMAGDMQNIPNMPNMTAMPGTPNVPNMQNMPGMPVMGGMPAMPYGQPQQMQQPVQQPKQDRVEVSDDFWKFFDGGKSTDHKESDDFFGSSSMNSVSGNLDVSRLKRFERQKNDYMSDTPLVDGSKLAANTEAKFNKLYMKKTETVDASDLQAKQDVHNQDIMGVTREVDADNLNVYKHYKSRISMEYTDSADANELEAYNPEHTEAIMAQADHAVEAMPKKKTTYVDEIDAIELPEYMQAKKTVRENTPEIPGLPEI